MAYLALFDILGFKHAITSWKGNQLHDAIGQSLTDILIEIVSYPASPLEKRESGDPSLRVNECSFFRFSDTILLFAPENDSGLFHLILTANRLLAHMILRRLPVRGAITRGDLLVDIKNGLIAGEGIIRAYELEQIQQWSGALVDPVRIDVPETLYENGAQLTGLWPLIANSFSLHSYAVPLKTNKLLDKAQWGLSWPTCLPTMPELHLTQFLYSQQLEDGRLTPREIGQDGLDKLGETVKFFRSYRTWERGVKATFVPHKFIPPSSMTRFQVLEVTEISNSTENSKRIRISESGDLEIERLRFLLTEGRIEKVSEEVSFLVHASDRFAPYKDEILAIVSGYATAKMIAMKDSVRIDSARNLAIHSMSELLNKLRQVRD